MLSLPTQSQSEPLHARLAAGRPYAAASLTARELGRLLRVELPEDAVLDRPCFATRQLREDETLVHAGDDCQTIYVVRFGCLKVSMLDPSGTEQGLGFPMTGDAVGVDGLASGRHQTDVIALEQSEVVMIPVARMAELTRQHGLLATLFCRLISREIVREQSALVLLGSLSAEPRVAAFLLNLADRFGALGCSRTAFHLRMSRQDIASYLGLKIETVCRTIAAFNRVGFIRVNHREVEILDAQALRRLMQDNTLKVRSRSRVATGETRPRPAAPPVHAARAPAQCACAA